MYIYMWSRSRFALVTTDREGGREGRKGEKKIADAVDGFFICFVFLVPSPVGYPLPNPHVHIVNLNQYVIVPFVLACIENQKRKNQPVARICNDNMQAAGRRKKDQ